MPCTFIREVVRHGPDTKVRSISEQGNSGWADRGKSLARPAIRHREKLRPARRSRPDGPARGNKSGVILYSMAGGNLRAYNASSAVDSNCDGRRRHGRDA